MLFSTLKGLISLIYLALITMIFSLGLYVMAILRLLTPIPAWKVPLQKACDWFPEAWISGHLALARYWLNVKWDIEIPSNLSMDEWVIVVSNHQTWVDPFAVHAALHKKVPFLKFFCKQDVIFIPFVNFACYALGCPMLKRYSKEQIAKNPALRNRDIETTLRSCERLRAYPSGVNNFLEGTRWTPKKYQKSHSPFKHLLPVKTGGVAYALQALQDKVSRILDVSILYPTRTISFWDYLCGRVKDIQVVVKEYPIPLSLKNGNYAESEAYRNQFKAFLNHIWEEKDQLIDQNLLKHSNS